MIITRFAYVEMLKCESIWHTSIYLWERDTPQFVIILIWGITFSLYTAHDVSFRFEFDHFKWSRTNETQRFYKIYETVFAFTCKQSNNFCFHHMYLCANIQKAQLLIRNSNSCFYLFTKSQICWFDFRCWNLRSFELYRSFNQKFSSQKQMGTGELSE